MTDDYTCENLPHPTLSNPDIKLQNSRRSPLLFDFFLSCQEFLYFKQGAKNEASPIEKSMCDQFWKGREASESGL